MKLYLQILFLLFGYSALSQNNWVKLGAGTEFSMGIQTDGTLWSWGSNLNGELGTGDNVEREYPTKVGEDTDWADVACGAFHALALKTDGTLWGWGGNMVNQLGNGTTNSETSPIQIGTDSDWKAIAVGMASNFAIKEDGSLWAWGLNTYGQLGDGTTTNIDAPTLVGTDTDWATVAVGGGHAIALKEDGTIWGAGADMNGQLGLGGGSSYETFTQIDNSEWIAVSCGFEFSNGIKADGTLWSWGFNANGQLGNSSSTEVDVPEQIGDKTNWISVKSGSSFAFALDDEGELYGTGFNTYGCLGDGSDEDHQVYTFVTDDVSEVWPAVGGASGGSIYGYHSLLLRNSSKIVICAAGANYTYQLGNGSTAQNSYFECETGSLVEAGIAEENLVNDFLVYPNPAVDEITIAFNEDFEGVNHLVIYNELGEKVLSTTIDNQQEKVLLPNFDAGVYFYKLTNKKGELGNGKLVVNP